MTDKNDNFGGSEEAFRRWKAEQSFRRSEAESKMLPMLLRDYFAGQILAGYMARPHAYLQSFTKTSAAEIYAAADAMLEARKR